MRTLLLAFFLAASPALAIDRAALEKLASGDNDEKVEAIGALLAEGDPEAAAVLAKFAEGEVVVDGKAVEVVVNIRLRSAVADALAALRLLSPERTTRLEAATALAGGAAASMLALVRKAREKETDPDIKPLLDLTAASMEMASGDKQTRLAAIRRLGESNSPNSRTLLAEAATDSDAEIRIAAQKSLREVQGKLAWGERAGLLFAGISLGSVLLLAALGLEIIFGLMGVVNIGHG